MLKSTLLHPQILSALGRAGHSSKVLIADGNYPCSTRLGINAELVNLNLSPGLVDCVQVLRALLSAIPVEAAQVMAPQKSGAYALKSDPEIWTDFRAELAAADVAVKLEKVERFKFYDLAADDDVALTIATGDQRIYANLLLTIGVVR